MFVHGREAYRRNSYLISYMFYKNVLFVFPMFLFGIFSVYSGTAIYDNYLYQLFNVFFTGAPIMWFGMMDFEHEKEEFMKKPKYYSIGLKGKECSIYFAFR